MSAPILIILIQGRICVRLSVAIATPAQPIFIFLKKNYTEHNYIIYIYIYIYICV